MIARRKPARPSHSGPARHTRRRTYRVLCTGCGKEVVIEVAPPVGKELFCLECFKK